MFNEDQKSYMRSLAAIPDEEKCYCGWYRLSECRSSSRSCSDDPRTAVDRRNELEALAEYADAHNQKTGHSASSNGYVIWCKQCDVRKPPFHRGCVIARLDPVPGSSPPQLLPKEVQNPADTKH